MRIVGKVLTKGYDYVESRCLKERKDFVSSLYGKNNQELFDIVLKLQKEAEALLPT